MPCAGSLLRRWRRCLLGGVVSALALVSIDAGAVDFDPAFLATGNGVAPDVDPSAFKDGNRVLPGRYRVDVFVNKQAKGAYDIDFAYADGADMAKDDAQACLSRD